MNINESTSCTITASLDDRNNDIISKTNDEVVDIISIIREESVDAPPNYRTSLILKQSANVEINDSSLVKFLQSAYISESNVVTSNNTSAPKKILIPMALCALGTGLANMPIFNNEVRNLEMYDLNVHWNSTTFAVSTINTMAIQTISSMMLMYNLYININNSQIKEQLRSNLALGVGIATTLVTASLPLSQLWKIEIKDQKTSDSHGFDEFIAWAAFTSLPLIATKAVKSFQVLHRYLNSNSLSASKLESIGAKIFVNGTCALATVGRFVAHASAINEVCKHAEIEEKLGLSVSIILGAISSTLMGACEYLSVRNLFKKQDSPATKTEIALSTLSTLEGAWFTLPTISSGLSATQSWNPLLQALTFAPLFVSHTIAEATSFYNSGPFQKETSTSINLNV